MNVHGFLNLLSLSWKNLINLSQCGNHHHHHRLAESRVEGLPSCCCGHSGTHLWLKGNETLFSVNGKIEVEDK